MFLILFSYLFAIDFSLDKWQSLEYSKIPANQYSLGDNGELNIKVDKSASPHIYLLPNKVQLKEFSITFKVDKILSFPDNKQGAKNYDDFQMRLGFIVEGDKTLSGLKAVFAPKWVKTLFGLSEGYRGLDKIYFYSYASQDLDWQERVHPLSELIHETIAGKITNTDWVQETVRLKEPKEVLAIWISIDGDDTDSSYNVVLKDIRLNPNEDSAKKVSLSN